MTFVVFARLLHDVISRRPIAVAIEERADNAAVEDARERLVFRFRLPLRHDRVAFREAAEAQPVRVGRAGARKSTVRRMQPRQGRAGLRAGGRRRPRQWRGGAACSCRHVRRPRG